MALNTRSIFHPRWQRGLGMTNNAAQTSSVLVRRKNTGPTASPSAWSYDLGAYVNADPTGDYVDLWHGPARVQPDKDWRARSYDFGSAATVFQAVRFSLPLVGGEWNPDVASTEQEFRDEDEILIIENFFIGLEPILKYVFTVREPLGSGVSPANNILTDVNLKGGLGR